MAAWTEAEFKAALAAYSIIISAPSDLDVRALVRMLEGTYSGVSEFLAFAKRLPVLVFKEKVNSEGIITNVEFNIESKRHKNIITEIASGNVGTVYRGSASPNMYKKIVLTEELNTSIREVFLETWIQTVLSLDPCGKVPKIHGLYRDSAPAAPAALAAPAAAGGAGGAGSGAGAPSVTLYIVMEPAGNPLKAYIHDNVPLTFATMKPIYRELGILLQHLQRKYGFYHRDLHRGNVLLNSKGISIIDFGESVIKKWDESGTYRSREYDGALGPEGIYSSFDLLKFLTSMFDFHAEVMSDDHKTQLKHIIGEDIFASIKRVAEKRTVDPSDPDYLFWQTSPIAYGRFPNPRAITDQIAGNPILKPAGFIAYLDSHKGGRRKIRKTQKKKNRGTRGRR